jgi:hypothetical protein
MKKLEDFTQEELWDLRKKISVGSMYYSDYANDYGISEKSLLLFFDSYLDDLEDRMKEDHENYTDQMWNELFNEYDNSDNLYCWWCCYEDFDWVEYNESEDKDNEPSEEELAQEFIEENRDLFDIACEYFYFGMYNTNYTIPNEKWLKGAKMHLTEEDALYLWVLAFFWMAEESLDGAIEWKSQQED